MFFLLSCLISCYSEEDIPHFSNQNISNYNYFVVTRVKDGDTFCIDSLGVELTIRPIGIDAPEIKNPSECFHHEAKDYLTNLINGKKVKIVLDKDRLDRYKRILAYVYLEDGTFVNEQILRNGFADTMNFKPNLKFKYHFLEIRNKAMLEKKGMWGECF